MAADDVYLALVRLDDPDTRAAAAAGDTAFRDGLTFTEDEDQLVDALVDEAGDDVQGFAGGAVFGALNYVSGRVSPGVLGTHPPSRLGFGQLIGPSWGEASCGATNCTSEPKKKMPGEFGGLSL